VERLHVLRSNALAPVALADGVRQVDERALGDLRAGDPSYAPCLPSSAPIGNQAAPLLGGTIVILPIPPFSSLHVPS
jgi:hypothetical protein